MIVDGIIYDINLNTRIISIKSGKNLKFYYVTNSLMKKFKKYLYNGTYASFVCQDNAIIKSRTMVYSISYFKEIKTLSKFGPIVHYSKSSISSELKEFVNNLDNLMFIDLEMSMPGYKDSKDFLIELIQASYIITDKKFNTLTQHDFHIMPTVNKFLSDRCEEFLNITYDELRFKGVHYKQFYNQFKSDLEKYNPTIIIFGKNDRLFLEKSYKTNNSESLAGISRFVNLSQLLKNYYELTQDPGLFKSYEIMYNEDLPKQKHDAYEDAYYTYLVFKKFKEELNKK